MKKTVMLVFIALLLVGVRFTPAVAGETAYRFDPVSQKSRALTFPRTWAGFKIFTGFCKDCHFKGNEKGASFLHTEAKSTRAWKRVFLTKYPKCAQDGTWDKLSQEDLLVLHDYLYSEARDTYNPYSTKGTC